VVSLWQVWHVWVLFSFLVPFKYPVSVTNALLGWGSWCHAWQLRSPSISSARFIHCCFVVLSFPFISFLSFLSFLSILFPL
jgi:hypothetical protein